MMDGRYDINNNYNAEGRYAIVFDETSNW